VQRFCLAFKAGTTEIRPVLARAKKTVFVQRLAALIEHEGRVFIQQRPEDDVWGGLWEFPGGDSPVQDANLLARLVRENVGLHIVVGAELATVNHQYTHHKITLTCYGCKLADANPDPRLNGPQDGRWVDKRELGAYGFPAGPRKVLEKLDLT